LAPERLAPRRQRRSHRHRPPSGNWPAPSSAARKYKGNVQRSSSPTAARPWVNRPRLTVTLYVSFARQHHQRRNPLRHASPARVRIQPGKSTVFPGGEARPGPIAGGNYFLLAARRPVGAAPTATSRPPSAAVNRRPGPAGGFVESCGSPRWGSKLTARPQRAGSSPVQKRRQHPSPSGHGKRRHHLRHQQRRPHPPSSPSVPVKLHLKPRPKTQNPAQLCSQYNGPRREPTTSRRRSASSADTNSAK